MKNQPDFNGITETLRRSFEDRKLSREEESEIGEICEEYGESEDTLRFIRNKAFEVAAGAEEVSESSYVFKWLRKIVKLIDRQHAPEKKVDMRAFFSPGDGCRNEICRLMENSRKSIEICVFTITDDEIKRAILKAFERNVKVRIVTDDEKAYDLGSDVLELQRRGIEVVVDDSPYHMHHKFAIFDSKHLLTGSFNWTKSASHNNQENILVTDDENMIGKFGELFESYWEKFKRMG